ncbi:hypothetical protein K488DRAFT_13678, partial [Vararia minispora EC-137]
CDNCLLLLPLRAGAIAWNIVILLYSVTGSILLFRFGPFWFFTYPEWCIYGGIGMAVAATALINSVALSNRSYIWNRASFFLWPFIIVVSAVRCIVMIVELDRNATQIQWECDNGGVAYTANSGTTYATGTLPSGFCSSGYSSLRWAFIFSLVIDLIFQIYAFFLNWRFVKRLEHYNQMKGPFYGG